MKHQTPPAPPTSLSGARRGGCGASPVRGRWRARRVEEPRIRTRGRHQRHERETVGLPGEENAWRVISTLGSRRTARMVTRSSASCRSGLVSNNSKRELTNLRVAESKLPRRLAKEDRFSDLRLHHHQAGAGHRQGHRNSRRPPATSDIEDARRSRRGVGHRHQGLHEQPIERLIRGHGQVQPGGG